MNGTVNHPTDAESEQLAFLTEECGESLQVTGKIGRHGLDSRWPKPDGPSNAGLLEKELGHVLAAIDLLVEAKTVDVDRIAVSRRDKLTGVQQWLHCEQNIANARAVGNRIATDEFVAGSRALLTNAREQFRRAAVALLKDEDASRTDVVALAWSLQNAIGEVSVDEALDALRSRIAQGRR